MHFALTDDQLALQASVRDFLDRHSDREAVRSHLAGGSFDRDVWVRMAKQLGLHGIAIGERHGGGGGGFVELSVVLEEMGRRLLPAPFLATVLAASLLQESGDEDACARWLPAIAAGDLVATLAVAEPGAEWPVEDTATSAAPDGSQWRLTGTKEFVLDGSAAALLLVTARTGDSLGLFAVDATAAGVTRTVLPVLDQTRPLALVSLASAPAERVSVAGSTAALLHRARDIAAVALAAEQVGGAQACLDMAVSYAQTRVQFDRPIGSFQAVKHKCADMFVDVESSRALVQYAAWCVASGDEDLPLIASATRSWVNEAYFRCAAQNLQIHGGIGYTWEHDVHLYLKRATSSQLLLGSSQDHRERVASLIGM
jgi:alkylation response protein AidB-like acyl-CoA dehydrogenase